MVAFVGLFSSVCFLCVWENWVPTERLSMKSFFELQLKVRPWLQNVDFKYNCLLVWRRLTSSIIVVKFSKNMCSSQVWLRCVQLMSPGWRTMASRAPDSPPLWRFSMARAPNVTQSETFPISQWFLSQRCLRKTDAPQWTLDPNVTFPSEFDNFQTHMLSPPNSFTKLCLFQMVPSSWNTSRH